MCESPDAPGPKSFCLPEDSNPQHLPLSKFLTSSGVFFSHTVVALSHATATHRVFTSRAFPTLAALSSFPPRFPLDVTKYRLLPFTRSPPVVEPEPVVPIPHPSGYHKWQPSSLRGERTEVVLIPPGRKRPEISHHHHTKDPCVVDPCSTCPVIQRSPEAVPSVSHPLQGERASSQTHSPTSHPRPEGPRISNTPSHPKAKRLVTPRATEERAQRPVLQPENSKSAWEAHHLPIAPRQAWTLKFEEEPTPIPKEGASSPKAAIVFPPPPTSGPLTHTKGEG